MILKSKDQLALDLCEALHLDPGMVQDINVIMEAANPIVHIHVTLVGDPDKLQAMDWGNIIPASEVSVFIEDKAVRIPGWKPTEFKGDAKEE